MGPVASQAGRRGAGAAGGAKRWPEAARRCAVPALVMCLCAAPAPAYDVRGSLGRLSVGGYVEGSGIFRVDPGTPRQWPAGLVDLKLTAEPHRKIRVFLDTHFLAGGTVQDGSHFGVVNLSDTFVRLSPSVEFEEGYVDFSHGDLDLRVGKQKFAWGRLDGYQPTNIVNPRRLTDPFIMEEQDAAIGVPALRADYFAHLPEWLRTEPRLTLVWVPVPIPARFPLPDERWFPASAGVPESVRIPGRDIAPRAMPPLPDAIVKNDFHATNRRPPQQLDEGAVGVRVSGLTLDVDWGLVFYDGPETSPAFDLHSVVFSPGARRHLARGEMPTASDLFHLQADVNLEPRFGRILLAGGDAAARYGGFTGRLEGAFSKDRLLPTSVDTLLLNANLKRVIAPNLARLVRQILSGRATPLAIGALSVPRDVVSWGMGIDYTYHGWTPLVQVNQTFILNNSTNLLINNVDTRLAFFVRRNFLRERMLGELMVAQEFERGYTIGRLRVTYSITDNLRVRGGYVLIAGSRTTLPGQFHDNDEAFLQLRYSY